MSFGWESAILFLGPVCTKQHNAPRVRESVSSLPALSRETGARIYGASSAHYPIDWRGNVRVWHGDLLVYEASRIMCPACHFVTLHHHGLVFCNDTLQ